MPIFVIKSIHLVRWKTMNPLFKVPTHVFELFSLLVTGTSSIRSSLYQFQSGEKSTVEVGQGNLKLTFSTNYGKITNYVNSRSLVCNAPNTFIITYYLKLMLTFHCLLIYLNLSSKIWLNVIDVIVINVFVLLCF